MSSLLAPSAGAPAALKPVEAERFFVAPDQPSVLKLKLSPPGAAKELSYALTDYWEKPVAKSAAAVAQDGAVEVTVKLSPGYYQLSFPDANAAFGVVAIPEHRSGNDPFFCIDSALSWLVGDADLRDSLVKVLKRTGIDMSRERMHWSAVHAGQDKFDWQTPRQYESLRQGYARDGVKLLEMFHDAPAWMGAAKANPYPADLPAAAQSWSAIGAKWAATWGALEIWNEPDIFFGGDVPADQYVPLAKAVAYAVAQAGAKTPLVGGVFTDGCPAAFREACAANGLLDHVDAISFHNYRPATSIEGLVAAHRAWLKASGKESMPLWITESGRPWTRGPTRPPANEDAASALDITMQAVEARACGAARHFPFVYPYYEENRNNFGMMGKEGTPLRCMAAYAQNLAALSGKGYLGDLRAEDPNVKRARVFADDKRAVAVLFTGQPKPGAAVKVKLPADRIEGIDGRPLPAEANGTIPIPDGLTYVWADRARIADLIQADTPAAALYAASHKPPPRRPEPSPIILQYLPDPNTVSPSKLGYTSIQQDPRQFPVLIRVSNLSAQGRKVRLTLLPPDKSAEAKAFPPAEVNARAFADVNLQADLTRFLGKRARAAVAIAAEIDGGPAVSPLVVRVQPDLALEDLLKLFPMNKALPIGEMNAWKKNIVGDAQMSMSVTAEGHWRMDVKFDKMDPWVYPFFALPRGEGYERAAALVIRARCENAATVRLMLHRAAGGSMTGYSVIPADGKWHAALVRFDDLGPPLPAGVFDAKGNVDLSLFDSIQVGLNGKAKEKQHVLEVSDLYLVGDR